MNIKLLYKNLLYWLIIALAIVIPLYPKFPFINVTGTYVAIRFEDFLIGITIILWGIYQIKFNRSIIKQPLFQAFALFWFIGLASLLSAIFITRSVETHLGILHWIRRLEFMLLFWVTATTLVSIKQIIMLLRVFVIVAIVVIFYGFGQLYLGFSVISTVDKDFSTGIISTLSPNGRVNSTFAGHYDLAIFISYFLIIIGGMFFYVKDVWKKLTILLISIPGLILLGFTASRISFASALAGLTVILLILKKRTMIAGLIIASIIIVMTVPQFRDRIIATVNVNILKNIENSYTPKATELDDSVTELELAREKENQGLPRDIAPGESTDYTELEVGRSISIRLTNEWPRAINAIYKNPIIGTGYSSLSLATDNDYLRALGETGIAGLMSFLLIFWILLKRFIAGIKTSNSFGRYLFIVLVAMILNAGITATFIDIFEASKAASLFWIILGTGWAYVQFGTKNK